MNAFTLTTPATSVKPFPRILRTGSASKFLQIRPAGSAWALEEVDDLQAIPIGVCATRGEATRTARRWVERGIPALFLAD